MRQAICDRITSYLPTDYETLKQENSFPIGMNLQAPRGIVRVVLCLVLAVHDFGGRRNRRTTGLCDTLPCRNDHCWCRLLSGFQQRVFTALTDRGKTPVK
jgi:hypothetical protein